MSLKSVFLKRKHQSVPVQWDSFSYSDAILLALGVFYEQILISTKRHIKQLAPRE